MKKLLKRWKTREKHLAHEDARIVQRECIKELEAALKEPVKVQCVQCLKTFAPEED